MAILIRGMQMPESCMECPLFNGYGCTATNTMFSNMTNVAVRTKGCPLVEVPKGAILIDARDVKKHMIPLDFSVQNWISEVDLDIKVPTIFKEDE